MVGPVCFKTGGDCAWFWEVCDGLSGGVGMGSGLLWAWGV